MTDPALDRTQTARRIILAVLSFDAGLILLLGLSEAMGNRTAPFHPAPLGWGIVFALPFVVAALLLRAGDGVRRSGAATFLAWTSGVALPLLMFLLTAISWGSAPSRGRWAPFVYLLGFGLLQMLIPGAVRWTTKGGTLWWHVARAAAILLVAGAFLLGRLFLS